MSLPKVNALQPEQIKSLIERFHKKISGEIPWNHPEPSHNDKPCRWCGRLIGVHLPEREYPELLPITKTLMIGRQCFEDTPSQIFAPQYKYVNFDKQDKALRELVEEVVESTQLDDISGFIEDINKIRNQNFLTNICDPITDEEC